jgi:hypothetical protein
MSEAIFGLVGVVVGATLSGFVSFALERRREHRGARASARLLEQELEPFNNLLYGLRAGVLGHDEATFRAHVKELEDFTLDLWTANREILAATLGIEEWYAVMYAYLALGRLRRELAGTSLESVSGQEGFNDRVRSVESAVYGAVDTLGRFAGREVREVPVGKVAPLRGSRW